MMRGFIGMKRPGRACIPSGPFFKIGELSKTNQPENTLTNCIGQAFIQTASGAFRLSLKAQIRAHHVLNSSDDFRDIPGPLNQQRILQEDTKRKLKNAAREKASGLRGGKRSRIIWHNYKPCSGWRKQGRVECMTFADNILSAYSMILVRVWLLSLFLKSNATTI